MSSQNNETNGGIEEQEVPRSRTARAGLQFPVPRILRLLREGNYANRVFTESSVYLASVIEYLVAEVRSTK